MIRLLATTSIAAIVSAAAFAPALAQSDTGEQTTTEQVRADGSGSGGTAPEGAGTMARPAGEVTCAEITAMDTATVPGVLYYISGYRAGQRDAGMAGATADAGDGGATGTAGESMSADAGAAAADEDTAAAGTDMSTTASTTPDAETGGMTDETAGADTDTAAADPGAAGGADASGAPDDTDMAAAGTEQTPSPAAGAGAGSGGAGQMQLGSIRGYFEIPVEQTLVACRDAPDSRVGDLMDEQGAAAN